ncbi:MAG: 16S rRNA (guanine(966)-N(2))-methyltransferase RsmD [Parahaliea sp.]
MPLPRKTRSSTRSRRNASQLRIIGGQWRGRKLDFVPADGLRPTTDRVRETLFNWLAPDLHGARCLDLFSGSGALGLEALSRGAASCDFVDTNSATLGQITRHLDSLGARERARCHTGAALDFLLGSTGRWDIVFIDPPFGQSLATPVCQQLAQGRLGHDARIYLESSRQEAPPEPPGQWRLHREKTAGGVCYRLYHGPETAA